MHHPIPQTSGIDIAKDQLDVCLYPDGATRHFPNDAKGHRALIAWQPTHQPNFHVPEAFGILRLVAGKPQ